MSLSDKKAQFLSMIGELAQNLPKCTSPELIGARNRLLIATRDLHAAIDFYEQHENEGKPPFEEALAIFAFALFEMKKLIDPEFQIPL